MIDLNASTEDLRAEFSRLAGVVADAEGERALIWQEITGRQKTAEAQAALNRLSPEAREALKGIL